MYEAYFGFTEKPFSLLPDPAFLFLGKRHSAALSLLNFGLEHQAGFVVLTGVIGSGKTTLIRHMLKHGAQDHVVGLISNTHRSSGALLTSVLMAFGVKPPAEQGQPELYQTFVEFLLEQYAKNRRTVLIVDEAQNLGAEVLEELRLLSNINVDKHQVLQTIIVGQPELQHLLKQPELTQFAQRISAFFHLEPLDQSETVAYIRHRLAVAGGDPGLFDPVACELVHRYTDGVPRLINLVCDTALVYGYGAELARIEAALVREVVRDKVDTGLFLLPTAIERQELDEPDSPGLSVIPPEGEEALPEVEDGAGVPSPADDPVISQNRSTTLRQTGPAETVPHSAADKRRPMRVQEARWASQDQSTATSLRAAQESAQMGLATSAPRPNGPWATRHPLPRVTGQHADNAKTAAAMEQGADRIEREQARNDRLDTRAFFDTTVQRLSKARRRWLRPALAIGLMGIALSVVYVAVQGLPPLELHTYFENADQPRPTGLEPTPAGDPALETKVEEKATVTAGTGERVNASQEESGASLRPAPMTNLAKTPEDVTPPDAPIASDIDRQIDDSQESAETTVTTYSEGKAAPSTMVVSPTEVPPEADSRVVNATASDPPPAEITWTAAPPPARAQKANETGAISNNATEISRLLVLANEALRDNRLTTPKGHSAYEYYQRVLELDADNDAASEIPNRIAARYAIMAQSALRRDDYGVAARYVKRGLRVQPNSRELIAVRQAIPGALP